MRQLLTFLVAILMSSEAFAANQATGLSQPQGQGFNFGSLIFLLVFFAIFYFLMIRPQTKRSKEHRQLLSQIKKDDEVVTTGGLLGKVEEVKDSFVELWVSKSVQVTVQKQAVSAVLPKGTLKF